MSKRLTFLCARCEGTGKVTMADRYQETYDLLASQREPINGAELAKLAGCSGAAMCNRLVHLERLGLARGERRGRQRLWTAR